ncbi:hypothetical protein LWI29_036250 [Acer saccharum]|uniref:Uncharacterized protein n=1 Tax=Acer saccharum TaxID=4024 RepID=A0AA39VWM0_ACESA|nr:hypothetical protein LWI29_036250 [Acer saccharum]
MVLLSIIWWRLWFLRNNYTHDGGQIEVGSVVEWCKKYVMDLKDATGAVVVRGLAPPLARLGYHMSPYLYQFQYRMLILLQVWLRMRPLVRTRSIALKLLLRTRGSHNLNMSTYQPNQAAPHLSRSGRTAPHLLQLTPSHFLAAKPSRYLTIPLPHLTCLS